MIEKRAQRRLAAILAADVVGYSRLMETDEEGTRARLQSLRAELIDPRIAADGGRIVKTMGDGLLVEFPSAVDAVRNALDVTSAIRRRNADVAAEKRIEFRVGINVGDVIVEGDDIQGDGVNIASRLEGICEPGQVYVSGTVYDQVAGKVSATFENLGEKTVKNIARPVRVFRATAQLVTSAYPITGAPQLTDKPSIAVLPFTNMSGDPEQEFFADGITEEIITSLSHVRQFFVIARNSTFQYKNSSPSVRKVTAELGVRYVIEGSLRKAGDRIRITAQLIDGGTGSHLWAERFDQRIEDIFDIQDEITRSIVGQIQPELSRAEYERAKRRPPEDLGAWELFHRGMALSNKVSKSDNEGARRLFERSLEIDPGFASAHAGIVWCLVNDLFFRFANHDPKLLLEHARKAVALDDRDPFAHFSLAWAWTFDRQPDLAITEVKKAIEINPSYALAHAILGRLLVHSGQVQAGIQHTELALRLSPSDPMAPQMMNVLAIGNLYLGNYRKAAEEARRVIQTFDTWVPWMIIVSVLGHLGDLTGAAKARIEVERHQPDFSIEQVRRDYIVFHEPSLEVLVAGLRKAGVPEQ